MGEKTYLIGIDIGTGGCKILLIDVNGNIASSVVNEYPLSSPKPLWSEQNPDDWWNATKTGLKKVLKDSRISPGRIAGIGLTGQMHGLVLLNKEGKVLRPAILWNDQRTQEQCDRIIKIIGFNKIIELTGNRVLTGFTAPKILWVRENEPEIIDQISHILLPKDFIRYKLTNEFLSDVSDSSGTSLFDVKSRNWSRQILDALSIPQSWLPEVSESVEVTAMVSKQAAGETGLIAGTPIVGGAGDQAAQAVGTGIFDEGKVSVTIGTSGVVFAVSNDYKFTSDGSMHAFCHAVPGKWHLMGVMLSAGGSFKWYKDTIGLPDQLTNSDDAYTNLINAAENIPAGSEGLIFLPYLTGERTPYPDPDARGVFFGLTSRHTKPHLTRSVIEGITFGLKDSLEIMKELDIPIKEIRISGGGAKSPVWKQVIADIFNAEISTVNSSEGAAFGAAILAGIGTGIFKSVEDACKSTIKVIDKTAPTADAAKYEKVYPVYRSLYNSLKDEFKKLNFPS